MNAIVNISIIIHIQVFIEVNYAILGALAEAAVCSPRIDVARFRAVLPSDR